jgi:LmbE family N-acetylglucosaminyl deacetylase
MGGTINRICNYYGPDTVKVISFSFARESIPMEFSSTSTFNELKSSMKNMHISNFEMYDFKVRNFDKCRQKILDYILECKKDFNPNFVFCPNTGDVHQDHQVITNETIRAFRRDCTILGYELLGNNIGSQKNNLYIKLNQDDMDKKIEMIKCYESQLFKKDMIPYLVALAKIRGAEINSEYAETFEVIRWVIK